MQYDARKYQEIAKHARSLEEHRQAVGSAGGELGRVTVDKAGNVRGVVHDRDSGKVIDSIPLGNRR